MRALGRQRPLVHLDVGGGGQVDHAPARCGGAVLVEVLCADRRGGQHRLDEMLEPALLVHPLVGLRPDAELLDVVEVDRRRSRTALGLPLDEADRFGARGRRGCGSATPPRSGTARALRPSSSVQKCPPSCSAVLPGAQEVVVVDGDVLDSGVGERRDDAALPDPLGEPAALGPAPDQPFQPIRQRADLADAVAGRDRSEHRLRIAAAEQLRLSAIHHLAQQRHVLWIVVEQPLQQPAAEVRGELEVRIAVQRVQERAVAQRVRLSPAPRESCRPAGAHARRAAGILASPLSSSLTAEAQRRRENRSDRDYWPPSCTVHGIVEH